MKSRFPYHFHFDVWALLLVAVYLGAWVALYHGFAGLPTILMLSVAPCCSFATFAIGRRNWLALCLTALFLAGHLVSSLTTFA